MNRTAFCSSSSLCRIRRVRCRNHCQNYLVVSFHHETGGQSPFVSSILRSTCLCVAAVHVFPLRVIDVLLQKSALVGCSTSMSQLKMGKQK